MATLSAEAKAKRAAYMREWRKRNKDKAKEYDRRRWERAAIRDQGDEWQQQQQEKTSA